MKTSILYLLLACACFSGYAQEDDNSPPVKYNRSESFQQAIKAGEDLTKALYEGAITPADFKAALFPFSDGFYTSGYITLEQSNAKKVEIDACVTIETRYRTLSGNAKDNLRVQRNAECDKAVSFSALASNVPACIQENRLAAGGVCCQNLKLNISLTLEATLSGAKTSESCTRHEDCRSKTCTLADDGAAGICAPTMTCFQAIPLNGECSEENPNCISGVCREQELGLEGVSCKVSGVACEAAADCCSGKCAANKCVDKLVCTDCVGEGQKPTGGKRCCNGFYSPDGKEACILEFPPFILPSTTSVKPGLLQKMINFILPSAHAQDNELTPDVPLAPPGNLKPTPLTNDTGLTKAQLDRIEDAVKACLSVNPKSARATCLLKTYDMRKSALALNNAAAAAGKPVGERFSQQDYVKRYNIPSIVPKLRSDVNRCQFNTAKDGWVDASNLQRNGELFVRAFEVSYSGKGTQDLWHLPDASGNPHKDNIYTRTKNVMNMLRDNRHEQKDQLKYLDLVMACQCMYTFGPEKFNTEQQSFFFTQCTGSEENKICREGSMKDSLKIPASPEQAYRDGKEFPNYVAMYLANVSGMNVQAGGAAMDVNNLDSSAAGINHEEVLVRWLKLRSCNQVDVFVDTEKVDTELQGLVDDLGRAKKTNPALTRYWDARLQAMKGIVSDQIIEYFKNDTNKDLYHRGYIDTESRLSSYSKKTPKFLFFLLAILLGGIAIFAAMAMGAAAGIAGIIGGSMGGVTVAVGLAMSGGGASGGLVMNKFLQDFPAPIIETRLLEKKSCMLGLFWCKKYGRILHWPAFSNGSGIENAFPFVKNESRTCAATASQAAALPVTAPNGCAGMFKGTQCARTFYRPIPDTAIAGKTEFAPWGQLMKDKMLMDPVFPEFYITEGMSFDFKWKEGFNDGFVKGCAAMGDGKKTAVNSDKNKFLPDMTDYFDANFNFNRPFQMHQERIDAYKKSVAAYALCDELKKCGAQLYDGKHPMPRGFLDIIETQEEADLFANYVYQIHFTWRHMSSNTGIGYPLAYLENYYHALQYNVRLLTTLSIRRGMEFDDTANRYAADLGIRRTNYQDVAGTYSVSTGTTTDAQVSQNTFYRDMRTFGFPLGSDFTGIANGTTITTRSSLNGSSTSSGRLSGDSNALQAARRVAARVAADNKKNTAFMARANSNKDTARRLAAASKFFQGVNSPTASMPSLANPKDSSSYSGIGGSMTKTTSKGSSSKTTEENIGPVDTSNGSGSGSGSGTSSSAGRSGLGTDSDGPAAINTDGVNDGTSSASGGSGSGKSYDEELNEASKVTGFKEGEVKTMLDDSEKNRGKMGTSDADSLFEKVSKAYMRNLDRVLIRKKTSDKENK